MAQIIPCDQHQDQAAVLIITSQDTGDIVSVCAACMTGFALAWIENLAPDMLAPRPSAAPRRPRKKAAAAVADDREGGDKDGTGAPAGTRAAAR